MDKTALDPNMPVDEIMRRWPATIRPFLHHRCSALMSYRCVPYRPMPASFPPEQEAFEAAARGNPPYCRRGTRPPQRAYSGVRPAVPRRCGPKLTLLLPRVSAMSTSAWGFVTTTWLLRDPLLPRRSAWLTVSKRVPVIRRCPHDREVDLDARRSSGPTG
jgi:hypothetical protein